MVSESAENLEVIRGGVPPEATETPPSSAVNVWPIPACLTPNRGRPRNDALLGLSVCRCLGDRGDRRAERAGAVSGTHVHEATLTLSVARKKSGPLANQASGPFCLGLAYTLSAGSDALTRPVSTWPARRRAKPASVLAVTVRSYQAWWLRKSRYTDASSPPRTSRCTLSPV